MSGRVRWTVAAVAALVLGGGGLLTASVGSANVSSFVPITPCRLLDTRATDQVGERGTPLGPEETFVTPVWGTHGKCTIPTGATGVSLGVTITNPTAASYLTVFPADASKPLASHLNWLPGQAPTPNAVTAMLSDDGQLAVYNRAGTVDVIVDIVGYYELATAGGPGPAGPAGPTGPQGAPGDPGPRPANVVWVAASGGDFTSLQAALASITDNSASNPYLIRIAPGVYTESATTMLKDYVDIEGSGENVTVLTCACSGVGDAPESATLAAQGPGLHAAVRHLTVRTTGASGFSIAVFADDADSGVSFEHVTAEATGAAQYNFAIVNSGNAATRARLTAVTATASGAVIDNVGVIHRGSLATYTDLTTDARVGVKFDQGGTALLRDSHLRGFVNSVDFAGTGFVRIINSVLDGPKAGGSMNCLNVFDPSLSALSTDCT